MKDKMFVSIVIVLLIVLGIIATVLMLTHEEEEMPPPTAPPLCGMKVVTMTEVHMGLPTINPRPRPTDLKVVLKRNNTHSGYYEFQTDNDGPLAFESGDDVGTIHYADLADNQWVNLCDELRFTELYPDSDYEVFVFWAHTGDVITRRTFSTPP